MGKVEYSLNKGNVSMNSSWDVYLFYANDINFSKKSYLCLNSKRTAMATIIVSYNEKDTVAQSILKMIKTVGVFKIEKSTGLDEAIIEMKSGDTVKCNDFDDYLKKVK